MNEYRPYRVTVVFAKRDEPEIVMQESFSCDREYSAEAWAASIERSRDSGWLRNQIQIINVAYEYTWRRKVTFDESDHKIGY